MVTAALGVESSAYQLQGTNHAAQIHRFGGNLSIFRFCLKIKERGRQTVPARADVAPGTAVSSIFIKSSCVSVGMLITIKRETRASLSSFVPA